MPNTDPCEICGMQARAIPAGGYDGILQGCPRCGEFKLSGTGIAVIRSVPGTARTKLSGWVREQNMLGDPPELTSDRIRILTAAPIPNILERRDRLLSFAIRKQSKLGEYVMLNEPALLAATYSQDDDEIDYLVEFLSEEGLVKNLADREIKITPSGYMRYEELQSRRSASAQGFVAMWFDESMRDVYTTGFEKGVQGAGYAAMRVDRVEHVNKIDDEIIAQIRRSRFVVADFTGHRGGVYFEAGFALGMNLPVFWACRKSEIGGLHFDIRQFNCIDWSDPSELADRLQKRVEAVIGVGPRRPLPQ